MMQATTSDARLLPGVEMIEELHNLRRKVHEQQVLLDMHDHVAQRECEARAQAQAGREAAERERSARELSESAAHFERLARRDPERVPYLKRIGELRALRENRPGTRRVWA